LKVDAKSPHTIEEWSIPDSQFQSGRLMPESQDIGTQISDTLRADHVAQGTLQSSDLEEVGRRHGRGNLGDIV
jgi:hypothetical protein